MIYDCNINNLAKNQVPAVFNSRAIRRSESSKLIEICMGRHVGAPDEIQAWPIAKPKTHSEQKIV